MKEWMKGEKVLKQAVFEVEGGGWEKVMLDTSNVQSERRNTQIGTCLRPSIS